MPERKEQELAAKNPDPEDDPFQLWAVSLNGALAEPSVANGDNGGVPERQRNGGFPAATAASRESRDVHSPVDKQDPDDWLDALRRRVRIENERRLLEQEAVSQALEEFGRVLAPVEARWGTPTPVRHVHKYETLLWRFAETRAIPQPEEAGLSENQDSRHDADAGQQSHEPALGQNDVGTEEVLASDDVTLPDRRSYMPMLLPNPFL